MVASNKSRKNASELSGAGWAKRYAGSSDTRDLTGSFRHAVDDFIYAMIEAGIKVGVEATYRPAKRSYLMHWSWRIVNDGVDPASVPAMSDVGIQWEHPSATASLRAAKDMVDALSMRRLRTKPALRSQHNLGLAIDMSLSWRGTVSVRDATGRMVQIKSTPRNGLNRQLIEVGASYGVKKYSGSGRDVPHWSNNGR
ncbi:hypothetical protein ACLB1G_23705 [Oxalobacteraceae bacterium A2-2]